MKDKITQLILQEAKAILHIPITDDFQKAVDLIDEYVHGKRGKLVVSGMGKAGQIGLNIATTFCSTGTCAVFLHPSEAQHGDLGILQPNDILLLLSNSGKTREILELIELSRFINPNIKIISITGNDKSELATKSDVVIFTGGGKEICPFDLTPTTSTTLMTVIGDILVVTMMEKIGFTKEDYAKRHHGGYNGTKSKS